MPRSVSTGFRTDRRLSRLRRCARRAGLSDGARHARETVLHASAIAPDPHRVLTVVQATATLAPMKPVFADPKTDIIFKKVFGQKAHKGLLIELLNALLELDAGHRIVDIEYLSPEQLPPRKDLKLSILDVKCIDARGTHYVVEMQV